MSRCGNVVAGFCHRGITGRSCGVPVTLLLWMVNFVTLVNPVVLSVVGIILLDGGSYVGRPRVCYVESVSSMLGFLTVISPYFLRSSILQHWAFLIVRSVMGVCGLMVSLNPAVNAIGFATLRAKGARCIFVVPPTTMGTHCVLGTVFCAVFFNK